MPYPINQRAHQFNSIQSVPVSFGLWDTALKFLSPGPRSDVTDHLVVVLGVFQASEGTREVGANWRGVSDTLDGREAKIILTSWSCRILNSGDVNPFL